MSNNETTTATLHDIEDGEIIEESSAADTMTLYEVDVMNLVKPMDLQQRLVLFKNMFFLIFLKVLVLLSQVASCRVACRRGLLGHHRGSVPGADAVRRGGVVRQDGGRGDVALLARCRR